MKSQRLFRNVFRSIVKLFDVCAYACSGNVLKVQALLAKCGEHRTTEESTEEDLWKLDAIGGLPRYC